MLHDVSIAMADHLVRAFECGTDYARLVAAIEVYEVARDGEET